MDPSKLAGVHPSVQRLYQLAKEDLKVSGPTEVALAIYESPQTIHNWSRGRGVSKVGAAKIQNNLGWSATWILEGKGPMRQHKMDVGVAPTLSPPRMISLRLVRQVAIVGKIELGRWRRVGSNTSQTRV